MKIDLKHIAKLAKLQLDEDKIPMLEKQMEDILGMVENLPPISDISGGGGPDVGNVMVLRPDEIMPSLTRDEVLANARQKQAGCIVVPKTVG